MDTSVPLLGLIALMHQRSFDSCFVSGGSFENTTSTFGVLKRIGLLSYFDDMATPSLMDSSTLYQLAGASVDRGMLNRNMSVDASGRLLRACSTSCVLLLKSSRATLS